MSFPVTFALIIAGLIVSAHARLNAVLFGAPVSIPWLGVAAVVLILGLVALTLHVIRLIVQDLPPRESRPVRPVHVITTLR
jgi:hypothetical protein